MGALKGEIDTKKEYFFVPYGYGYQHGTEIIEITEAEYKRQERRGSGAYFDNYAAALWYTMD